MSASIRCDRRRYTTSKLRNVYCTYECARRLAGSPDSRLQSLRVNAFDPGLMPATDLARTYSAPVRFVSRYILPALSLFMGNVNSPAKSGHRLALIASGEEGPVTGKYFSDGKEIRSSTESYDTQKALDLWNSSATMTGLPSELCAPAPRRELTAEEQENNLSPRDSQQRKKACQRLIP